jgi:2-oxoglutarate ferredoxin oxidoreductase subunit alpha
VLWHLEAKIRARAGELARVHFDPQAGARTLLLGYGVTARAMRLAVRTVRQRGGRVAGLTVQSLFPVPENELRRALHGMTRVVVAEENMSGQYRTILAPWLRDVEVVGVNKIGSMITPEEITDAVY